MITDKETNTVYLADGIRHYMPLAHNLLEALYREKVDMHFLRHTESRKHVWVRDYMPIQLEIAAPQRVPYFYGRVAGT